MTRTIFEQFGVLNNESIRSINELVVLNLIRERRGMSRADVAKTTGLKESTVSSIAKSLLEEGLICEAETGDSSGGRKPVILRINSGYSACIGVEVGVRRTTIALSNFGGEILHKKAFPTSPDPQSFLKQLLAEMDAVLRNEVPPDLSVETIGFGVPGLIDRVAGRMVYSAGLGWRGVDIGTPVRQAFGREVLFEDDVRSAGFAEIWFGGLDDLDHNNLISLLIEEGLGTAIIIEGQLYRGSSFGAGQFGHVSLDPRGPQCRCGNRGCWEGYASDPATIKRYLSNSKGIGRGSSPPMSEVVKLAKEGDRAACDAVRQTGEYLGAGIAMLANTLNPELIVIQGEIGRAFDLIEPAIWDVLRAKALALNVETLKIRPSSLKENASLMGAIALVICRKFARPKQGGRTWGHRYRNWETSELPKEQIL
jgi:predicted NBD/HSP70 family sugar kinase